MPVKKAPTSNSKTKRTTSTPKSRPEVKKTAAKLSSRKTNGTVAHEEIVSPTEIFSASFDRKAVERRAWEIWQNEGCPDGRELEHWLRAERELAKQI